MSSSPLPLQTDTIEELRTYFLKEICNDLDTLAYSIAITITSRFVNTCSGILTFTKTNEYWNSRGEEVILKELERLVDGDAHPPIDLFESRENFFITLSERFERAIAYASQYDINSEEGPIKPYLCWALEQYAENPTSLDHRARSQLALVKKLLNSKLGEDEKISESVWKEYKNLWCTAVADIMYEKVLLVQDTIRMKKIQEFFLKYFLDIDFQELIPLHHTEYFEAGDNVKNMKDSRAMVSQLLLNVELYKNGGPLQLPIRMIDPSLYDSTYQLRTHITRNLPKRRIKKKKLVEKQRKLEMVKLKLSI